MKAYLLSVKYDDDQGQAIVFSKTAKEAKKKFYTTNLEADTYINIRVRRCPEYDDMGQLKSIELVKEQWRNGWRWYDYNTPYPEDTTDEEFYRWYKKEILGDDSN